MTARYHIIVAALMVLVPLALGLDGCAPTVASNPKIQRSQIESAGVSNKPELPVCRRRQEDKVFEDVIVYKVPVHDDRHQAPLDCDAMLAAEKSALESPRTIPVLDLGFIWLGASAQWMQEHPEVPQCVEKVEAPNFVLSRFLGRADGTQGPTTVLLRKCDQRMFFVTNAKVPPETRVCGDAHIPDCPTAAQ